MNSGFRRTRNLVWSRAYLRQAVAGMVATDPAAGVLSSKRIRFFTNEAQPIDQSVLNDFTPAALTAGTTGVALGEWSDPISLPGGRKGVHQEVMREAEAGFTPEVIHGYVVYDDTGEEPAFVCGEMFEHPVSISQIGSFVSLDLIVALQAVFTTGVNGDAA